MLKNIVLSCYLLVSFSVFSQQKDYSTIDQKFKQLSASESKNLAVLSATIEKNTSNDYEKVRAIFVWISANIGYDFKSFETKNIANQDPESVFKYKSAVCQGYSELFKRLCNNQKISCEVIAGYSKGLGYKPGKKFKSTDHAWNAVKIDNKWYLIDATWGSGYIDQDNKYIRMFSEEFFLSDPKRFTLKHLPSDPIWQLLNNPILLSTFEKDSITIKQNLEVSNPKENFADTLRSWESLDSTQRTVTSNLRILRFNPDNTDAWYKIGWFYYTLAWNGMNQLNNQETQRNRALAVPIAKEAIANLNEALKYMNEIGRRDPLYGEDVKQKKQMIAQNIKNLQSIVGK